MAEGVDGLLRDRTRPSRIPPLGPEVADRVVALTLTDPPVETTHWTAAMMAKAAGISVSSVQRIWRAHMLADRLPAGGLARRARRHGADIRRVGNDRRRVGRAGPGRLACGGRRTGLASP